LPEQIEIHFPCLSLLIMMKNQEGIGT